MDRKKRSRLLALVTLSVAVVFVVDLATPIGFAVWVLYLPVILLAVRLGAFVAIGTAGACSVLSLVEIFLTPPAQPLAWDLSERFLGLVSIWTTVTLGLAENRRSQQLIAANARLKETEEKLVENERRLQLALEASNAGVWSWDALSKVAAWDDRCRSLYGFGPDEARSFDAWIDRVHPDDRARLLARIDHLKTEAADDVWDEVFRVQHPLLGERWMFELGRVQRDQAGRALRFTGINIDVTARKRTEEAVKRLNAELEERVAARTASLRENQEKLEAILQTASDAIIIIDDHGIIQSVNRAAETIFGHERAEMVGKNVAMLMPSPFREEHDGYIARCVDTGIGRVLGEIRELVALRKDGALFPIEIAINRVNQPKLFTGIVRDISHRKKLERDIIEISTMEQQRIGQDLHDDCGQELTGLGLLSDTLVDLLRRKSPDDAAIAVSIREGLRRLLQRIRAISRSLAQTRLRAPELPKALLEMASRIGETSGVNCNFRRDERVIISDDVHATHLYHIAQEACTNALRHSKATSIDISLGATEEGIVLQVRDDGVGLGFPRHEGLGLQILRNRATLIGGRLSIDSEPAKGTTVKCVLPREQFDQGEI